MLQKFSIQNYRCFKHVSVDLAPLTVLIGPNNTGKTNFLTALTILGSKEIPTPSAKDHYRHNQSAEVALSGSIGNSEFKIFWPGKNAPGMPRQRAQPVGIVPSELIRPVRYFVVPRLDLSMSSDGLQENQSVGNILSDDGKQIPALIDYLLRKDRKKFEAMVDALRELIPGMEDLAIETPNIQTRRIDLVVDGGLSLPASDTSFGVRLLIFFAALAFHPEPPKLLLIEEPETGVHPKRLKDIVTLLRAMTKGERSRYPVQVIISTHSPYLLDCVDLAQDAVLVFERLENGERIARPIDKEKIERFRGECLLGELWYSAEEKGLVGKGSNLND